MGFFLSDIIRALSLRNPVSGYECGSVFPAGVGPDSLSRDAANWRSSRFSRSVEMRRRYGWLRMVLPSSAAASIYLFKPPYAIGSVPSLSGHAIACRWRSLPRVRRHRASKSQGNSKRVLPWQSPWTNYYVCVCVSSHPLWTSSSLDVPAGVTQEEGHTGFLIHLLSAMRALIFLARRIQPFLSLVDREVEFCVLTILIVLHSLGIFSFSF